MRVKRLRLCLAKEGPAEYAHLRPLPKVRQNPPPASGYDISSADALVASVRHACGSQQLGPSDVLVFQSNQADETMGTWVSVATIDDFSKLRCILLKGKQELVLYVGFPESLQGMDTVHINIFQHGLDYIEDGSGTSRSTAMLVHTLNRIKNQLARDSGSDGMGGWNSVFQEFHKYTSPAFKLNGVPGADVQQLEANDVQVNHRYGRVKLSLEKGEGARPLKGVMLGRLAYPSFRDCSDSQPYKHLNPEIHEKLTPHVLQRLKSMEVLAVFAFRPKGANQDEHSVRLDFDRAFSSETQPILLDFVELDTEAGLDSKVLLDIVPEPLQAFLQALILKEPFVLVTDGNADCTWCQVFRSSALKGVDTYTCVPCVLQHYPKKVDMGEFQEDTVARSGLQEFWHAWAWILHHNGMLRGPLNATQIRLLRSRLEVLENFPVTRALVDDLCLPFTTKSTDGLRGVLLHGPPGTGKTSLLHHFRDAGFYELFWGVTAHINTQYVGETEKVLKSLANSAATRAHLLHVFFFDEIETHARKRTLQDSKESNKRDVLSVLLGIVGRAGIVVLACTNFLHQLDDAMVRPGRLEKWIPVLPFSFEERLNFFAEKVLSVFDGAGKGLCRPSGWSVADLMDSTVADLDLLRRKSGILMAKVNESGMSQVRQIRSLRSEWQPAAARSVFHMLISKASISSGVAFALASFWPMGIACPVTT
ncbi:unnamed protein product [Durusdinium trenchii]|uniref:AAA+ ATPase domain-containing protein n=1 Tax=Durusdinium trenchii TaxID=1381693 RepID=A0ABP0SLB6_9DINO